MVNFEHTKLQQTQSKQLAQLPMSYKCCCTASKFDVGKSKVEFNLPLKATAVFKNKEPPL